MRWLLGLGIVALAAASMYFVMDVKLEYALICMLGMFALTNAWRAKTFKDQGMERESKLMKWVSLGLGGAFVVLGVIAIIL